MFMKMLLDVPKAKKQIISYTISMSTGQPNVNGKSLSNVLIPIPPIEEQHRIVAKIEESLKFCEKL